MKKYITLLTLLSLPFITHAQLYFTENKGQWDKQVLFKTDAGNGAFFLSKDGYTILMQHPEDYLNAAEYFQGHSPDSNHKHKGKGDVKLPEQMRSHAYRVKFLGANFNTEVIKEKPLSGYENYFIGNDPSKWASEVKQYGAVTYKNIYPNVDLRYYVQDDKLKYDLIVYPGADVSKIKMNYDGAASLSIKNSELIVGTSVGNAVEQKPFTYQFNAGKREYVNCRYKLNGTVVSFDVNNYNKATTLIIDPSVVFTSFAGSTNANWGFTATPGPDGSFYGGGIASSTGFPVSTGAFQGSGGGGSSNIPPDIALIRLSPDGSTRIFATYLGGGGLEQPHSLVTDAQGNLIIAGRTNSANFPVPGGTARPRGGYDIFVAKLRADGRQLLGCLLIGGTGDDGVNINPDRSAGPQSLMRNYGDDGRSEVILDGNGNILVASCTQSTDFPATGGFQTSSRGQQDGVVLKINPACTAVLWSTYLGGNGNDAAFVIEMDPLTNRIYVAGGTASSNLQKTTGNLQAATGGGIDGFISRLVDNVNSVTLDTTTYLGTAGTDIIYGIKFDRRGFPYVMGTTTATMDPINNLPPTTPPSTFYHIPNARQFIAKITPDLSGYVYRLCFGTPGAVAPNISPTAFLVDNCENVYVSGWGGGANTNYAEPPYPTAGTTGLFVSADARQPLTDGSDFYFFVLSKNATGPLYGSFFGQRGGNGAWDHVDGGTSRFDAQGVIYQAVCANCRNVPTGIPFAAPFPTQGGVFSPTNPGTSLGGCNLGMTKQRFDLAGVDVSLKAVGARQLNFCLPPGRVQFEDTVRLAKQYVWVWGDGGRSDTVTTNPIIHNYLAAGDYNVTVYGIDKNSCNEVDSATMRIRVFSDSVDLGFNISRRGCTSLTFDFTNTSTAIFSSKPFTPRSFVWSWDDGSRDDTVAAFAPNPISHTFPSAGRYRVRLALIDTNFCNLGEDTTALEFEVATNVEAGFRVSDFCVPGSPTIIDESRAAQTYLWVSSDGQTSTDRIPQFFYNTPGTYTITQTVFNPNTCNLQATSPPITVRANPKPTAGFFYNPNPSQENTPTRFTSTVSPDVVRWLWNFGDGNTSTQRDPLHQYIAPNPANRVIQIVYNQFNCTDTAEQFVESIINIVNELPSAFSPDRSGVNDVFRVRGFGISKMTLRVFNRQGLLVFESRSQNIGWDGTYKGVPQPMDAYAWTLDLEYFNGEKVRKKGDVTLLR
jgi:gliding motility-associated-like protein